MYTQINYKANIMQEFVSINYTLFDLKLGIAYNVSQWEILINIK